MNKYLSAWYEAIDMIGKKHPSTLTEAAKPNDVDEFVSAKNNDKVSVDVALNTLVKRAAKTPQTDALAALIKAYPSNDQYKSTEINTLNPPVATHLKVRVEQLLHIVETRVDAFVDFASNGTFSAKPFYFEALSLVDRLYPEGAIMVSLDG